MMFKSTKGSSGSVSFEQALTQNMAADGGLFVPESFPKIEIEDFLPIKNYSEFAYEVLKNFTDWPDLKSICQNSFNFPVPLTPVSKSDDSISKSAQSSGVYELELYHGPTLAFKDFGARFLANCLNKKSGTILVATSGDTGGAVAGAFWKHPSIKVIILFPNKKISKRQEHQLTCWHENIHSFAVNGTFDDCQRMVKFAFRNNSSGQFLSANSINIGRILPQMVYYAFASLSLYVLNGKKSHFYIPSGNVGNACAAIWARALGFPIEHLTLSTNANSTLFDYSTTAQFSPRASVATLANAMDVGNPSNFERILHFYKNDHGEFKKYVSVFKCSDELISKTIQEFPFGRIVCPHTATAYAALLQGLNEGARGSRSNLNTHTAIGTNHIVVATAHPVKFETIVEPLIQQKIPIPESFQECLNRKSEFSIIESDESNFLNLARSI